jgi:hypothetical protein
MSEVELPDGRRVGATHDWSRDWWVAKLEGDDARVSEGHWLLAVLSELLDAPRGEKPDWFFAAVRQLAGRQTPLGWRFRCRCCGYLTLTRLDVYEDCPVCGWEDDPTTIWLPGERAGPGPNSLSLTEGRRNFAAHGIANPLLKDKVPVRDPLPDEHP